jgi:hypothetical protein
MATCRYPLPVSLLVARMAEFTPEQHRQPMTGSHSEWVAFPCRRRLLIWWCRSNAHDFKQVLNGKRLLGRIKVARLYARKADEALHATRLIV